MATRPTSVPSGSNSVAFNYYPRPASASDVNIYMADSYPAFNWDKIGKLNSTQLKDALSSLGMNPSGTKGELQTKLTLHHLALTDHEYLDTLIKDGTPYWTYTKAALEKECDNFGILRLSTQFKRELVALLLQHNAQVLDDDDDTVHETVQARSPVPVHYPAVNMHGSSTTLGSHLVPTACTQQRPAKPTSLPRSRNTADHTIQNSGVETFPASAANVTVRATRSMKKSHLTRTSPIEVVTRPTKASSRQPLYQPQPIRKVLLQSFVEPDVPSPVNHPRSSRATSKATQAFWTSGLTSVQETDDSSVADSDDEPSITSRLQGLQLGDTTPPLSEIVDNYQNQQETEDAIKESTQLLEQIHNYVRKCRDNQALYLSIQQEELKEFVRNQKQELKRFINVQSEQLEKFQADIPKLDQLLTITAQLTMFQRSLLEQCKAGIL